MAQADRYQPDFPKWARVLVAIGMMMPLLLVPYGIAVMDYSWRGIPDDHVHGRLYEEGNLFVVSLLPLLICFPLSLMANVVFLNRSGWRPGWKVLCGFLGLSVFLAAHFMFLIYMIGAYD